MINKPSLLIIGLLLLALFSLSVNAQTNITACGTFSTNGELYNLNATLVPTGGSNCLTFTGQNQTFDGNNFRIENTTFNAIGIRAAPSRNFTVQNVILNLSTSSSTNALDIRNSEYAQITNVTVLSSYVGFRIVTQNHTYVKNLTITGSANSGISCGTQTNNLNIENSYLNNTVDSIDIVDCSGVLIKNSTIIQLGGGRAIDSTKSLPNFNNLTVIYNTIKDVTVSTGVYVGYDSNVTICYNDFNNVNAWIIQTNNLTKANISNNVFRNSNVQGASPVGIDFRNWTTDMDFNDNFWTNLTYEVASSRMVWIRGGGVNSRFKNNRIGANVTMLESFETDMTTVDSRAVFFYNYTFDGNVINCHNSTNSSKGLDLDGLVNSLINNNSAYRCQFGMVVNNETHNNTFSNNYINFSATGISVQQFNLNNYFINMTILNSSTTGITITSAGNPVPPINTTFDRLLIYGAGSEAIRLTNVANYAHTIVNSNITATTLVTLFNSTGLDIINTTTNVIGGSIDKNSSYERYWHYLPDVQDNTLFPIGYSNISIKNVSGAITYTQMADITGIFQIINLLQYTQNNSALMFQTPYNVTAQAGGFSDVSHIVNLTSNVSVYGDFFMLPLSLPQSQDSGGGSGGSFTPPAYNESILCEAAYYFIIDHIGKDNILKYNDADLVNLGIRVLPIYGIEISVIKNYINNYGEKCGKSSNYHKLPYFSLLQINELNNTVVHYALNCNSTMDESSIFSKSLPLWNIGVNFYSCENFNLLNKIFYYTRDSEGYKFAGIRLYILIGGLLVYLIYLSFKSSYNIRR